MTEYKGFTREEPSIRYAGGRMRTGGVKAVEKLLPIHKAQLLSYMKLLNVPLGCSSFHEIKLTYGVHR